MFHLIMFHLLWALQTPAPVPPSDFSQIGAWLIMPATLGLIANLIISGFFSQRSQQWQNAVRLLSFLACGLVSYALTKLSPDLVVQIQPLWAIFDAVIAAFYATNGVKQLWRGFGLIGLRMAIGKEAAKFTYDARHPEG